MSGYARFERRIRFRSRFTELGIATISFIILVSVLGATAAMMFLVWGTV